MDTGWLEKAAEALRWLLVALILLVSNSLYGQQLADRQLSLQVNNMRLDSVLTRIERQAGVSFAYSSRKIPVNQRVTFGSNEKTLRNLLNELLSPLDISWSLVEQQIVLVPTVQETTTDPDNPPERTYSGYLRDDATGEALIGATVFVEELASGTITNPYGFFSLTIPEGTYKVRFSYIGYTQLERTLTLDRDIREQVELKASVELLPEVIVTADPAIEFTIQSQMGKTDLEPREVRQSPALMGETDIIKSLQRVPGVKMFGDGSTYYYVRGGEKDHNMILIDEAPIYNPSHLLGIFSTFIPEAAKSIDLYKGDIPIQYGGRISSLLDVRTREGSLQRFGMSGSLGLLSGRLSMEAPVVKNRGSFFISGRRSYLKPYIQNNNPNVQDFYFYDLNAKLNYRLGANDRVYFSFYNGRDVFSERNSGISWSNGAATFRWNHTFSEKLFMNTTIYGSNYEYLLNTDFQRNARWNSRIENLSLKADLSYFSSPDLTFHAGFSTAGHRFNPGNFEVNGESPPGAPQVSRRQASELMAYGGVEQQLNPALSIKYGVRFTLWQNRGEAFEFLFDEAHNVSDTLVFADTGVYHRYGRAEPRISLNFHPDSSNFFSAGYNYSVQNIHMISNSISPFTSLDVWLPSGPNIRPQGAHQVFAGYQHVSWTSGLELEGQVYYKHMTNQIEYEDHANTLLNPLLEGELRFGKAKAYGFELSLERRKGKFRPSVAYTWSRVIREIAEINGGRPYPALHDRPHVLNVNLFWAATDRVDISLNWFYATGSAYSAPTSFYYFEGTQVPVYGDKNNARFPDYHRADLSATFHLNRPGNRFRHNIALNIFNLYGRRNPVFINYNKIVQEGNIVVPVDQLNLTPRLTTQTWLFGVLPSVSYNFQL